MIGNKGYSTAYSILLDDLFKHPVVSKSNLTDILDEEEVLRMSEYLQDLELALRYYEETDMQVDFESGNMFLFSFGKDKKTWNFGEEHLPFTAFQFGAPKEEECQM